MSDQLDFADLPNLRPYAGRWVAIIRGRVVGVGHSREQANRTAKQMRPKETAQLWFVDSQGRPELPPAETARLAEIQGRLADYPLLHRVMELLRQSQGETYLVGGAVRDLWLGRPQIVDFDFALPQDGLAVARQIANQLGAAFYPLDPERGTGRVVCELPGEQPSRIYLDFAAFRGPSLAADLADRDFTINAIALALTDPLALIDPLDGQADLERGQIRATSALAFEQDPVRVLRAVRQGVDFEFTIEPQTEQSLRQAAPQLQSVSPERQRDELQKLFNTPRPARAVRLLQQLAVLPQTLPEVAALAGLQPATPSHPDLFEQTLAVLATWVDMQQAGWPLLSPPLRPAVIDYLDTPVAGELTLAKLMSLALLLQQSGQALTDSGSDEVTARHSARLARQVMNRLRFSSQAIDFVATVVAHQWRPRHLSEAEPVSRRAIYRFFQATTGRSHQAGVAVALQALVEQQAIDPAGSEALARLVERLLMAYFQQRAALVEPRPLLTGRDLIESFDLAEGRLIGLLLERLREAQAAGEIQTRAEAMDFIKSDPDFATYRTHKL